MEKKKRLFAVGMFTVFLASTLFFLRANPAQAVAGQWIDEEALGRICIDHVVSSLADEEEPEKKQESGEKGEKEEKPADTGDGKADAGADEEAVLTSDPLVIIYHTHSTESYMPYDESNYHRESEEGTVREAGTVLEKELKSRGINVIHDKTVHDRPSYNESYSRSLSTVQTLMKKYPTAVYIVDLHRDAAPASATEGKVVEIEGKRAAAFSLVVGSGNENYVELYDFAERVSDRAETMYEGFGGPIIEKEYRYNEYVSNRCLLLEIGNNKNTIDEAKLSAEYFGAVLAEIIKEEQKGS